MFINHLKVKSYNKLKQFNDLSENTKSVRVNLKLYKNCLIDHVDLKYEKIH